MNVEKRVVRCPNPKCASHEGSPVLRGHELFQQGQVLKIFVQDGVETIGAFVLGCHDSVRCNICSTVVPIPCLFRVPKVAEDFWKHFGCLMVRELWNEIGGKIFPSFLGMNHPLDEKVFLEKLGRVNRYFPLVCEARELPFVFLETEELGHLSRANVF